jgi:uncharacterized Zn-binding protein involved in type VI secretion
VAEGGETAAVKGEPAAAKGETAAETGDRASNALCRDRANRSGRA